MNTTLTEISFYNLTCVLTELKDLKGVNNSLAELGMDSLMAVEVQHTLERNF